MTEKAILKVNEGLTVDAEHGIVSGWGIVSTVDGEPYFDLNVDVAGVHANKRVPEHITEDAVINALIEAGTIGVTPGNEMHAGPDTGVFVGMFALTADIAKAMGITTSKTGLMVQYKPEADVLAKFKDGTYTGFSMEGARIQHEEIADD